VRPLFSRDEVEHGLVHVDVNERLQASSVHTLRIVVHHVLHDGHELVYHGRVAFVEYCSLLLVQNLSQTHREREREGGTQGGG